MEAKDWAPWAGIVVSLGWNAFNSYRANQQRRQTHALTEFKGLKAPVDLALGKLRANKAKIRALEVFGGSADEIKTELQKLNQDISSDFNSLIVGLEALDTSSHSARANWVEQANLDWDDFISAYDRLYAPKTSDARKQVLATVITRIDKLIDGVHRALEAELNQKAG